jgi:hypothetical protein
LALFWGCASGKTPKPQAQAQPDPLKTALGQATERVLWNRAKYQKVPKFPVKLPPPEILAQKGNLTVRWEGSIKEAVEALAKSIGYEAKFSPKVIEKKVFLEPNPELSVFDHLFNLNKQLEPQAGLYIDPINKTLSLKVPRHE